MEHGGFEKGEVDERCFASVMQSGQCFSYAQPLK
jgi:hypothetical protein